MLPISFRFPSADRRPAWRWTGGAGAWATVLAAGLVGGVLAGLAGCAAGPDYARPPLDVPAAFKEVGPWKVAQPQPAAAGQPGWQAFGDGTLDQLIAQADAANQTLRQAEAQYRQAHALAAQARAAYWPSLGLTAGASRARSNSSGTDRTANDVNLGLAASWEPDLWGSVRRSVEAGEAGSQASADDLAAARLSIQAELAQDYWQLRVTDLLRALYAATVRADAATLKLTRSQYAAGVALRSDVALAESQLASTQAQAVDLDATRSQLEHAIAVLVGQAPATFSLASVEPADESSATSAAAAPAPLASAALARLQARLPVIPAGVPSALLERRPDIAAAERRVAQANANIGVARAAYFPSLVLGADGGFNGTGLGVLFDTPSRVWSLGATLAQTLFDGGLRASRSDQAVAAYDGTVALYRQTVLTSFQQVEDNLAALRVLGQEIVLQDRAVQAARTAERSALAQYRAGTGSYLAVLTAQTLLLGNQRAAAQTVGRQLAASVSLISATGGGWQATPSAVARADIALQPWHPTP
jgi:NodT family efflux transporter outer membrane factor (OMF) lipoprotein